MAFSPDGREFYLDIYSPLGDKGMNLLYMRSDGETWTAPGVPPFASLSADASPAFSGDGNRLFFVSDRPGARSGGIWYVDRVGNGWSQPVAVEVPWAPALGGGWGLSVTNDGTIYMQMVDSTLNTDFDIYRIPFLDGRYSGPERLGDAVNSSAMDLGSFIDPNEDFLIFTSNRPGGLGDTDLYVCFRQPDGSWTEAQNMGAVVNTALEQVSPYVSPDGRYLFYGSGVGRNPYWVDARVVELLRP